MRSSPSTSSFSSQWAVASDEKAAAAGHASHGWSLRHKASWQKSPMWLARPPDVFIRRAKNSFVHTTRPDASSTTKPTSP